MKIFGLEVRSAKPSRRPAAFDYSGPHSVGYVSQLGGYLRYGATDRNWATEAGQLESNSTIAIAIAKIARKVAQASLQVQTVNTDGSVVYTTDERYFSWLSPLPELDEATVQKAVACSLVCYGNAYVLKLRSRSGLWVRSMPIMPWQVRPKSDHHIDGTPNNGSELITRYQVTPYGGGQMFDVAPSDMVHFRDGMTDPTNPALGMSPLSSCLRQVVGDNEIASLLANLAINGAMPGVIFSPKSVTKGEEPSKAQRESFKSWYQSFVRDRRGQVAIAPFEVEMLKPSFSPADLQAIESKIHNMTEILAAIGIDPMILGLPSDSKTYANMEEAREAFIEDCILALLSVIAKTLNSEYYSEGIQLEKNQSLAFNPAVYRELNEDIDKAHKRAGDDFKSGGLTRGEYRKALGCLTELDDSRTWFDLQAETAIVSGSSAKRYSPSIRRGLEVIQSHAIDA